MKVLKECKCLVVSRTLVATALLSIYSHAIANDEFQQWMQQQSVGMQQQVKEFEEYKDARDKEFTAFLKANWKAVDLVQGEVRDESPKPDVMPVAPTDPPPVTLVKPEDGKAKPIAIELPKPDLVKKPMVAPVLITPGGRAVSVDFYGRQVRFNYDAKLKREVTGRINKDMISDYWSALSRTDYEDLLSQLDTQKTSLQLNDWAYASLVNGLATRINNGRVNESALLSWFLLAKSGYKARVAYSDIDIYLLMPSKHEMFEVSYFTLSGTRYYAVEFDGNNKSLGTVYTYKGEYPKATNELDMRVSSVVASSEQPEQRRLSFKFEGKVYNIDVSYDRGRLKFFSTYPQLNLDLYFSSAVYRSTATPLQRQLAAYMNDMDEQQAVNFLLRFVQTSLKYETDEQQFGRENYLFPEETLFYPYSDCEDRAVLFAWLVESLLGLDVVGLDYPGHVAAAVKFNGHVAGDDVSHRGARYVVADPTYINAVSGMTMPDFRHFTPKVISY
jgi:hypothetical protein